jgi:1-acyl-sn-glycerol-3-phosphate acyltransferase
MKGNPFRNFLREDDAAESSETPPAEVAVPAEKPNIPPAGRPTPQSYIAMKKMFTSICNAYFSAKIEGVEQVPETGPCLILSNHASYLDPFLVAMAIPREVHFLARQEVVDWPVLGRMMQNTHAIKRTGIDRQAITLCREILGAGWPLIMFPEGTRSPDGKVYRPRGGFAWVLETMADVPCVPVYLEGSFEALKRGAFLPRPEPVHIHIGPPYKLKPRGEDERRREYFEACADELEAAWRELGADVRSQELDY